MIILGIDTSTSFAGVGLSVDGVVTTESWYSRHNHGREVMPAVLRLLDAAAIKADDIDAVAVGLGPGGFSAVRVGIATANGLVAPRQTRQLGIPTHLTQAYPHRELERNADRVADTHRSGSGVIRCLQYAFLGVGTTISKPAHVDPMKSRNVSEIRKR